jgi:plastocyanin/(2Fe-2S) ferredoxin
MKFHRRSRIFLFVILGLAVGAAYLALGDHASPSTSVARANSTPEAGEEFTAEVYCDTSRTDLMRQLPEPWMPDVVNGPAVSFRVSNRSTGPGGVTARPSTTAVVVDVGVAPDGEFRFDPANVTINVGDTVKWTWINGGHSVLSGTPCTPSNVFCSPDNVNCGVQSAAGATYSRTFTQAGTFAYYCFQHCMFGMSGSITVNQVVIRPTANDFDNDGKADIAVFRPSAGSWFILQSSNNAFISQSFGAATDRIAPGDFDGDHKTDMAVFRPSEGSWYILRSTAGLIGVGFGVSTDVAVANDYDGDGKADVAVFRDGAWYYLQSSNGAFRAVAFGLSGDKPVPGDYDGDGKADLAVFRPSSGNWFILRSTNNGLISQPFGAATDKLVPADYDGDNKTDIAVYRPSEGAWYLLRSTAGFTGVGFGISTDVPAPSDYDGDGKADVCVYRDGAWYMLLTTNGSFRAVTFGISGDKPVPSAYVQ